VKLSLAHNAAFAYETLRQQLIDSGNDSAAMCRSILLREGMLAWAKAFKPATAALPSVGRPCASTVPPKVATELVQIMAGLILNNGREVCHA